MLLPVVLRLVIAVRDYLIVRTDFFAAESFKYKHVFIDHITSKEPCDTAAKKIARLVELGATGIFHIGGQRNNLYNIIKPYFPDIEPCRIADSPMPHFPRDMSLNTSKYERFVGQ